MTHSDISIISLPEGSPIQLTDRWGEYIPRKTFKTHWDPSGSASQAYENLRGQYDQGEMDPEGNSLYGRCSNGDPRKHLQQEISFVAVLGDKVGIHVEVELLKTYNDEEAINAQGDDSELTVAEFTQLASTLQDRLTALASRYPHTQFFITHGDQVTFEGRVTVNAFTPLLVGMLPGNLRIAPEHKMLMVSPYFEAGEGANITDCPSLLRVSQDLEHCVSDLRGLQPENAA